MHVSAYSYCYASLLYMCQGHVPEVVPGAVLFYFILLKTSPSVCYVIHDFTAVYVSGAYPEVVAGTALLPIEVLLLRSPAAAGGINQGLTHS